MDQIQAVLRKHLMYCEANNWAGIEPYDALNSKVFEALPFLDSRIPRLALTQFLKRSPVNIRKLMLIGNTQNPKTIALFLSSFVKLSGVGLMNVQDYIEPMIERLITLRSPNCRHSCWGYSFPWQTRTVLVPRWAPNLVCTYFAADALLDAYEAGRNARWLDMAVSAAEYILNDLYWNGGKSAAGFAYPLSWIHGEVHNANFLAAALLCRVYRHTGDEKFVGPALCATRHSLNKQNRDGSWYYGEEPTQRWIDNFHTGYNIGALRSIGQSLETKEFEPAVRRGFEFYRARFFREDGAVRYYHDRTYPIDTHCAAQSIITLLSFKDLNAGNVPLAHSVHRWVMDHMWDDRGFFYYRVLRSCTIRTSYMRWTQAWMFLALSMLLCDSQAEHRLESEPATTSLGALAC